MAVITGGIGNDSLPGGIDADSISGLAGNDTLTGGNGNDTLVGGAGDDSMDGGSGADRFILDQTSGTDTIAGSETGTDFDLIDATLLPAGSAIRVLLTTPEAGTVTTVAGAQLAIFSQIEQFALSSGNDIFLGSDSITAGTSVDGGAGADSIAGTGGADTLVGSTGVDTLRGGAGADSLSGGADNDLLAGGEGNDTVDGGDGDDTIVEGGGTGAGTRTFNWVNNFDGADPLLGASQTLFGGPGAVNLTGDANTDREYVFVQANSSSQQAQVDVTPQLLSGERVQSLTMSLTLDMGSQFNADWVDGFSFSLGDPTTLTAERENGVARGLAVRMDPLANLIELRWNGAAFASVVRNNLETRGVGTLTVNVSSAGVVTVQAPTSTAVDVTGTIPGGQWTTVDQSGWQFVFAGRTGSNTGSVYIDDVNLSATIVTPATTGGNDVLAGGLGNDIISGGAGDDSLDGGTGNDTLDGGTGNDTVDGGTGNDSILGSDGNDLLRGGDGDDSIFYGAGNDTVDGGDGNDLIDDAPGAGLSNGDNQLSGGAGNDTIFDSAGNDTVDGGTGNDLLIMDSGGNDSAFGGAGDDTLLGNGGNDTLNGGIGNDSVSGGDGDDRFILSTGDGSDTIAGGEGAETAGDLLDASAQTVNATLTFSGPEAGTLVSGTDTAIFTEIERFTLGAGNDTVNGGTGNDSVDAGSGNDTLSGGAGNDTLSGGAGNDTLSGGAGADILTGGDGDDRFSVSAGTGTDTVTGGELGESAGDLLDASALTSNTTLTLTAAEAGTLVSGTDTVSFTEIERFALGAGNDSVTGSSGADSVDAGGGNDTLSGGAGNDTFSGGAGNDLLIGGSGNDTLLGGDGNDTLEGTAGDTLSGGTGDDVFRFDRLAAGTAAITVTGGTNSATGLGDVLSLQGLTSYTATWTGGNKASGSGTLTYLNANGDLVTVNFSEIERVICFARGSLITTARGEVPVQALRLGDLILTADRGYQPVRWLASRRLSAEDLIEAPNLRPIRIRAGALGNGLPRRDLTVSPQHRILVRSKVAERMFGSPEVLMAAKHLLALDGVEVVNDGAGVEYWHLMCDRHEVIFAEGTESETLFTGPEAMAAIPKECRDELFQLFPDIATRSSKTSAAARPLPKGAACRQLVHRHILNGKPMLSGPPTRAKAFAGGQR